jgi:acyl carrier protein
MGLIRMTPEQGIIALDAAMRANVPPQLAVMPMDLGRAADIELLAGGSGLLADLGAAAPAAPSRLAAMTTSERTAFLQEQLARVVGDVLQIGPGGFDVQASLTSLGLDSLIAIQIRNRIQKEIGVTIPLVNVLKGGSVVSLVDDVLTDVNGQEGPQQ